MNRPFEPNIIAFKKDRRRRPSGNSYSDKLVKYNCGIVAVTSGDLFSYQIEAIRKTVVGRFKRQHKPFIRCFPGTSYTSKPFDIRRGRGKGSVDSWYFFVREGKIVLEFSCPDYATAMDLARTVNSKLSFKTKLIFQPVNIK